MNPFPNIYENPYFEHRWFTVRKFNNRYAINYQASGTIGLWKSELEMKAFIIQHIDTEFKKKEVREYKLFKAL